MKSMQAMTPTAPAPRPSFGWVRPLVDLAEDRHDADAVREFANTHGYLFFREVIPVDLLHDVRRDVVAQLAACGWLADGSNQERPRARRGAAVDATQAAVSELQGHVQWRDAFRALRSNAVVQSALQAVHGVPAVPGFGDVCRIAFPKDLGRTTLPHQDHFFLGLDAAMWTAWMPIIDCPVALGGLVLVPGSHVHGVIPHDGEGGVPWVDPSTDVDWAGASYRLGDVVLFSGLTLHAARPNVTPDRIRLSVDCRYRPAS